MLVMNNSAVSKHLPRGSRDMIRRHWWEKADGLEDDVYEFRVEQEDNNGRRLKK